MWTPQRRSALPGVTYARPRPAGEDPATFRVNVTTSPVTATAQVEGVTAIVIRDEDRGAVTGFQFVLPVRADPYTLTVFAPGYRTRTWPITGAAGDTVPIDATLEAEGTPSATSVDVLVLCGTPGAMASVDGGTPVPVGDSGALIRAVPLGMHRIVVEAEGFQPSERNVTVQAQEGGSPMTVQFSPLTTTVVRPAVTTGTLLIDGVTEHSIRINGQLYSVANTDARFRLEEEMRGGVLMGFKVSLLPGTYPVEFVSVDGRVLNPQRVTIREGEATVVKPPVLAQVGSITVTCPTPGAYVTLDGSDTKHALANGGVELVELSLGQRTITVSAPGYKSQSQTATVIAGTNPGIGFGALAKESSGGSLLLWGLGFTLLVGIGYAAVKATSKAPAAVAGG